MTLRRCWKLSRVVPRLLWNPAVFPAASVPEQRHSLSAFANTPSCYKTTGLLLRSWSSGAPSIEVSYDRLKQLLAGRKSVVIDVREPWELREYGFIPGSVNVPHNLVNVIRTYLLPYIQHSFTVCLVGQVSAALQLGPEEFREKYGAELPQQTDNIVFSCLAGIRSKTALETAVSLGYKDVQHYPGGWQGWVENEKNN